MNTIPSPYRRSTQLTMTRRLLLAFLVLLVAVWPLPSVVAQEPVPKPQPAQALPPSPIVLPSADMEWPAPRPRPASSSIGGLGPGWRSVGASPVTREEALRMLQDQAQEGVLTSNVEATQQFPSEAVITTAVWLLARALHFDPTLIFAYVHDHIDYVPTFGAANGASGTLWAGRGNDFHQSSLFIALMRASGYTANYMSGIATYPMSRLANWLGVSEDQVPTVAANGGMLGVVDPPGDRMRLFRVWASAEIDGQTYWFDPAMKEYQDIQGINLPAVLGYSRAGFLSRARAGAQVTSDSVRNLNESNVRADLAAYSMNLVNYLRQNMPDATLAEVLGDRSIVPLDLAAFSTELPYALSVENAAMGAEINAASRHKLRIRYQGIDHTFATSEVAGRRITLMHLGANNDQAALLLDGVVITTGNTVEFGEFYDCTVDVDHPYPAANGTYADESYTFRLMGGAFYVLAHDFGTVSPRLLGSRRDYLAQAHMYGLQDTELVWCESLWLIGLGWQHQIHLLMDMLDRLGQTKTPMHHMVGL
ncbi:MAG: transglutaminase domain-containing protein, partial [Chloroflexi bacterium]|nr:transglutaminase domain-containing protein [Chloroflexota bacterium]